MLHRLLFVVAALFFSFSAIAETPNDILAQLRAQAEKQSPSQPAGAPPFSASRGDAFFHAQPGDWSCATCHTADPRNPGKHKITGKAIEPLAPSANAKRFTNPAHVEKWFKRNCKDVLKRECTATEKGDVLTYLLSLK